MMRYPVAVALLLAGLWYGWRLLTARPREDWQPDRMSDSWFADKLRRR